MDICFSVIEKSGNFFEDDRFKIDGNSTILCICTMVKGVAADFHIFHRSGFIPVIGIAGNIDAVSGHMDTGSLVFKVTVCNLNPVIISTFLSLFSQCSQKFTHFLSTFPCNFVFHDVTIPFGTLRHSLAHKIKILQEVWGKYGANI